MTIGILFLSFVSFGFYIPKHKPNSVFTLTDFRKTIELNGKKIGLPDTKFPGRLTIIPEKRLLMFLEFNHDSDNNWLHFYSLDSFKLIKSVIKNGSGEGEILGAFQLQYNNRNGGEIYITDVQKQQIMVYKVDSLIVGNERPFKIIGKSFSGRISFSTNDNRIGRAVIIDDSYNFVDIRQSALNDSRMLFNKYRIDFSVRDSFGLYPQTTEEVPAHLLNQVLIGCLYGSTDSKYLVFTGLATDYLSVYDTSGKMIASAIGPGGLDISYKIQKMGGGERVIPSSGHYGYGGNARINKGAIYTLYNGKSTSTSGPSSYHSTELFQFTYKLNPTTRYKLDIPIYDFEIDWRTKRLYGINKAGEIPQLVIFQL